MSIRSALAVSVVALALSIGVLAGITADQYFRLRTWRELWQQRQWQAQIDVRRRDPRQWALDSARMAHWERVDRQSQQWGPREIERHQAMMHCAVSFQFRDTLARHMQLMNARAWDRNAPGTVVSQGWAFQREGFQRGDTVTVVIPDVWCGDIVIGSFGTSLVLDPPGLGLDVR